MTHKYHFVTANLKQILHVLLLRCEFGALSSLRNLLQISILEQRSPGSTILEKILCIAYLSSAVPVESSLEFGFKFKLAIE
jgi:hypothetical protein